MKLGKCDRKKGIDKENMSCYDISHKRYVAARYSCLRHKYSVLEGEHIMEEKKVTGVKKFFGGIVLSFVILGLFLGLQIVIGVVAMVIAAVPLAAEAGGDAQKVMVLLQEKVTQGSFMTTLTAIATAISAVIAVFFYWLIWGRKKTAEEQQYLKENVIQAKPVAMITIAAVGTYFLAILIASVIEFVSPETMEEYNALMESALGGSGILAFLAAAILAPINEECILRGLILRNLKKYFSVPVVVILQAVMFGIFHMNWVQGLYVLPIGAALGYVAVKSRSVLPCIYMHFVYNLMSFVLGLLPDTFQSNVFAAIAVAVSVGILWLLYKEDHDKSCERVEG